MSTLNKINLDGNVYNISNFHYIENNSASNPFIITEHEPGIYVVKGSDADTMPGKLYSKYINSEDYNVRTDNFNGFLCLTDTSIDETYQFKNIGYIFDASQALAHPCVTQPAPYGMTLTGTSSGIGNSVVKTRDNQTIDGKKTFKTLPESSAVPATDNQLTNKKYVDDSVKAISTSTPIEGTDIFGWYATTQDGAALTHATPQMIESIAIGEVYEWPSNVYTDGTNSAVVTSITKSYDHWSATRASGGESNYKEFIVYMGNHNVYTFAFDDTTVYKNYYPGDK